MWTTSRYSLVVQVLLCTSTLGLVGELPSLGRMPNHLEELRYTMRGKTARKCDAIDTHPAMDCDGRDTCLAAFSATQPTRVCDSVFAALTHPMIALGMASLDICEHR